MLRNISESRLDGSRLGVARDVILFFDDIAVYLMVNGALVRGLRPRYQDAPKPSHTCTLTLPKTLNIRRLSVELRAILEDGVRATRQAR